MIWPLLALSLVTAAHAVRSATPSPVVADAVVASTAQAYLALPPGQRQRTVVVGDTFMYASYIDAAPREVGLPPAAGGHVSYGYMPGPTEAQGSILVVGTDPFIDIIVRNIGPFFTDVRQVATWTPPPSAKGVYGGSTETRLWLRSGKRLPWPTLWPAIRSLA